jgi:phosphate/sulfate permease
VSWGLGARIALAWLVTIPAAAIIAWVAYAILHTAGVSG